MIGKTEISGIISVINPCDKKTGEKHQEMPRTAKNRKEPQRAAKSRQKTISERI
ncbi:hypothetical protein [Anoxynatronum sibiricum]|uniref:hypothetical protein n=1 Tax=Anoxynatronum sibiricum TaxID=210623 RepID=UPI0031B808E5